MDVRIIAATNRDLAAGVREGSFREDLYYRLSVIPIHLPPLRERGDDVLLLSEHFITILCDEYDLPCPVLSMPLRDRLLSHPWPGNVRELRNSIERALVLCADGTLDPDDLFSRPAPAPAARRRMGGALPFPATLEVIEEAAVREMLSLTGNNKSAAAQRLGISRSRLHRMLKQMAEVDAQSAAAGRSE